MAKSASFADKISAPLGVKWTLKENEDGMLEWHTENKIGVVTADGKDKKKRVRETRHPNKRSEVIGSSTGNRQSHHLGGHMHGNRYSSSRTRKQIAKHTIVMLEDIKAVAYDQLAEVTQIASDFDTVVFKAKVFDDFLLYLLFYFDCFFKREDLRQKSLVSTSIEPGQAERKNFADACARVEVSRKCLGTAYCHLVLGLGLENAHHMACGSKRVSDTHRDKHLYETMYGFSCFAVWVTFRRKQFDVIKKEMGTTLRSDTFNPAIRVKNAPENDEDEKTNVNNPKKKQSPAEYRRLHPKRPAIKHIINQRSPALVSILPSSKEEATYLFKHERSPSPSSLEASGNSTLEDDAALQQVIAELQKVDLEIRHGTIRIGILHDSMDNYNPMSLQGGGQEEEANPDEEGVEPDTSDDLVPAAATTGELPPTINMPDASNLISRQNTAISHATTEAPSELP